CFFLPRLLSRRQIPPFLPYTTLFRSSEASILSAQPVPTYEVGQRVRLVSGRSGPVVEVLGDDRYRVELPRVHEDQEQSTSVHARSEEHTSELQSRANLACRLLPENKM